MSPDVPIRAITVRQPWATAIVGMGKDVENRTRNLAGDYRGPVAIHAGAALPPGRRGTRTEFEGVGEVEYDLSGLLLRSPSLAWPYRLPLGGFVGVVDLVDVHQCSLNLGCWRPADVLGWVPALGPDHKYETCSPWGMARGYHLVLANPRRLSRPIPAKGHLGLWTPGEDVQAAIREQLRAVA